MFFFNSSFSTASLAFRKYTTKYRAMKKVTLENYKEDKYYPKIVIAVDAILNKKNIVKTALPLIGWVDYPKQL